MPKVVTWGERCFANNRPYPDTLLPEKPWPYNECFAVASVTPSPGLPRWEPPAPPPVDYNQRAVMLEIAWSSFDMGITAGLAGEARVLNPFERLLPAADQALTRGKR